MPAKYRHRNSEKPSVMVSFLKTLVSVLVLTAFVIGITYLVRGVSTLSLQSLLKASNPVLTKLNINIDEEKIEQVAGSMVSKIRNTDLSGGGSSARVAADQNQSGDTSEDGAGTGSEGKDATGTVATADGSSNKVFTGEEISSIGFLSDCHSNFINLNKAQDILKQKNIKDFFFMGDLTELGLIEDLREGEKALDSRTIDHLVLSGDHDLWKTVGYANYLEVFEKLDHTKNINGVKFVLFDNSPNYTVAEDSRVSWFEKEIADADYVLLSQPLYETKIGLYMGKINGEEITQVIKQRDALLDLIRKSGVKAVISGDLHSSGQTKDPVRDSLTHIYIGALTEERNLQTPRFSILKYYDDASYDIQDVVLE